MFKFEIGDEYAWISPPRLGTGSRNITFFKVSDIRNYADELREIKFSGHPYYRNFIYYLEISVKGSLSFDLRYDVKMIKIENEQQKLGLKLKYA